MTELTTPPGSTQNVIFMGTPTSTPNAHNTLPIYAVNSSASGVQGITAGPGISTTGGTGSYPMVSNTGILDITTDATIATTGGSSPQLSVAYPCGFQTLNFQAASAGSVQFVPNGTTVYINDAFIPLFGAGGSRVGTLHNFIIPAFSAAVTTGSQYLSGNGTPGFNGTVMASNSTTTMNKQ